MNTIKFDKVSAIQGAHELHLFFAPAKEIISFVSVNQKEEDKDGGYQRSFSPARTAAIAKWVDQGNALPLSLLITLEKRAVKLGKNSIEVNVSKKSGWVIDGQHRLIGAMQAAGDILLPVVAFVGLSLQDQIEQFVTVNKEAKGVPTSLYYSLLKRLPAKLSSAETAKERAADIALRLKVEETSAFAGRIVSTTAPKNGQLSLVNFVRKVSSLVKEDSGLLGSYSIDEQCRVIDNFYLAIRNAFPVVFEDPDSVFFQTIGFGALMNFFPVLFGATLGKFKSFSVADATKALGAIAHIDPNTWKSGGTGNAAELAIGRDISEDFRKLFAPSGANIGTLKLD